MDKDFILVSIAGLAVLLTLVFVAQSYFKGGGGNAVVEEMAVVPGRVATTSLATVEETVPGEVAVATPSEAEAVVPVAPVPVVPECVIIDDFSKGSSRLSWFAVNDGVMGGLSAGAVSLAPNALVHAGVINTNGGGFSSVRAGLPANALVGYTRLHIRLNTFGRQYAVNFGDNRYRNVSHRALLPASPGDTWQEVFIDFDQTVPTRIGFQVDAEPFAASAINELSLILADGADGPFRMEVAWIKACL
jgi:hypothetical protein